MTRKSPSTPGDSSKWLKANRAAYHYILSNDFDDTLAIASELLEDKQDLIQKTDGWMLREVGTRDRLVEERFLKTNYRKMPGTMLRYVIEKFPETTRQAYLKGRI